VCSSSTNRQPVILTDDELNKINKEHPGFLRSEDVIKYGTDKNKQFNYICPRYWCLKNNTIVDPKDITEVTVNGKQKLKSKNCGYVLDKDATEVTPGHYVYDFYGSKTTNRFPGFQIDKHPDGYCLPCCFDKYNTLGRIKAKNKCVYNNDENDETNKKENKEIINDDNKEIIEEDEIEDEYIKGPEKFPLLPGKWGYLPFQIQTILREENCEMNTNKQNVNKKNKTQTQNKPCLLRHGVEVNDKQSFISCISDILFYGEGGKKISITDMKEYIIKAINIDDFITYQNGNLVNNFNDPFLKIDNFNKYLNTVIYSKINLNNNEETQYLTKVISAYENFILYLKDNNIMIDHTYLWDIISKPNKQLFKNGVNLIILNIPNDDITNNVEILCPTNHYSNEMYESRKPCIILMKEDNYYEPIYSYKINKNKINISKYFKEYDPNLSLTMRKFIKELIKPIFLNYCKPLESMPNTYKTKRPLLLLDLIQKLDRYKYDILKKLKLLLLMY
jgi:hypothetical protein